MKLLRIKQVMEITGLGRSTIYQYINENKFPHQHKLGSRSVCWVDSDINDWMNSVLRK
jgi:prophage regulatory protein